MAASQACSTEPGYVSLSVSQAWLTISDTKEVTMFPPSPEVVSRLGSPDFEFRRR